MKGKSSKNAKGEVKKPKKAPEKKYLESEYKPTAHKTLRGVRK